MRYFILIAFMILTSLARAQNPPVLCDHKHIPIEWPQSTSVALVGKEVIFTSYAQFSELYFQVKNTSPMPLVQFAALVEVFDSMDRHLITFAAHSISPDFATRAPSVPKYFDSDNGRLDTVLYHGESTNLVPYTPIVAVSCPVRAQLSFLQTDDIDGKQFKYATKNIRLDASLKSHRPSALLPLPVTGKYEKLVTVQIDEQGVPLLSRIEYVPEALPVWINKVMKSWTFSPAQFNGTDLAAHLDILFRFHSERKQEWSEFRKYPKSQRTFIAVDVYPPESGEGTPTLSLGKLIVSPN